MQARVKITYPHRRNNMALLIAGLILFLGAHSVRIFADGWRGQVIERIGEKKWKGMISLVSLLGFVLLIVGYGSARMEPVALWQPPVWGRHLAILLNLAVCILLVAAYVPRNSIKARLGHPMVAGVKMWAIAHLLANGTLADLVLFGSFLLWAVLDFRSSRRRDRAAATVRAPGVLSNTLLTVALGTALWAALLFWLHAWLIGVQPLAM
jgi:uncharacterized membrane protein